MGPSSAEVRVGVEGTGERSPPHSGRLRSPTRPTLTTVGWPLTVSRLQEVMVLTGSIFHPLSCLYLPLRNGTLASEVFLSEIVIA